MWYENIGDLLIFFTRDMRREESFKFIQFKFYVFKLNVKMFELKNLIKLKNLIMLSTFLSASGQSYCLLLLFLSI